MRAASSRLLGARPQCSPCSRSWPLVAGARCRSSSSSDPGNPNPRHGLLSDAADRALVRLKQQSAASGAVTREGAGTTPPKTERAKRQPQGSKPGDGRRPRRIAPLVMTRLQGRHHSAVGASSLIELLLEQLQALASEASDGVGVFTWPEENRSETDVKSDLERCVALMKDLDVVQQMDLPQISKTLELLRTAMWLDGDLLRAVARRAVDVLEARGLVGAFPRGLDELLSRFAYFGHEPLGEDCRCRLVEAVMRAADEVDLKHTHQITRLARAAAILGRPELAEGRVRRLYMEQIESLAGKQEMSGPGDDREKALSALQQWFLGRGLSEPPAQADLDELAVAARETFVIASSRLVHQQASALQTFVIRAARKAERNFAGNAFALNPAFADPEQVSEHVLDNGISIDCAFPGYLLAIEADGPAHFFWNRPDVPNGRTVFKHQLLRHEGWLVVSISATDWYNHYREGWGERLRFREETALIARRVREEDEKSEHSSSARFQGLVSAREAVIFETSTEEYQKRRPVQEETAPDEAKQDRSKPDMSQILAAQQQQTELSAAEKMRAENRSQADEQRRERGERAEEARAALQRQRADAAKQKRQLREQQSEAEKQSVQLLVSQRESLEGDFGSSLDRDWSWESDCLDNPLEHDLVSVYVLGVSSGHPGSAAQLWAVLEEVGWDNAQVVFGCGRLTYQEFEEQKDGVWYDCRSRVRLEARLAKERSYSDARNNHPKGSRNQKRAQLEAGDMELPQFWCCAPSVLDLWEPWLKARAPSKADEDQWRMSSGENLHIVEVISDALSSGPKAQLDNDAKIQYTLRGLAEQRRQRTVDDAVSIYQRYEADHAGEGPSEGSLLALVHAAVAAEDGGEPDAVVERITRLAQAGVSVEDSRREQQLRDMEATPSSLPHRAFSPGHIAAAVQEVVIPEVLLKFDSLKEQQRGHRKSTTVTEKNAPAIVMVVEDSDYHSMRQLMADPEAWAEPQPLPVRCELRTSALQQLLDVGIRPHVRALESLFDDPTNTFREEWKQIWSARMEEDGRSDLIEAVYENVDRAMDDGPGFIEEAFTINEHGQLRDECYPPTLQEAKEPSQTWLGPHYLQAWHPHGNYTDDLSSGWLQLPKSKKVKTDARQLLRDHYRLPPDRQ